jgi:hypothetical protein
MLPHFLFSEYNASLLLRRDLRFGREFISRTEDEPEYYEVPGRVPDRNLFCAPERDADDGAF